MLCLPAASFAQADLAAATYFGVELGTGKVSLNCPASTGCSPVDTNRTFRAGHRFNPSWAFEVTYARTDADVRDTPTSAKQSVTVRTLGAGIAFNF
ncbi:MAG: hypothetical protein ACK44A_03030 [Roseateles sp.]